MGIYIYPDKVDEFVEYIRTLSDDAAVNLVKTAVREANRDNNIKVLFRNASFVTWMHDMYHRGAIR